MAIFSAKELEKLKVLQIPLTQGKVALVDDKDFELVSKYKWSAGKHGRRDGEYCAMSHKKVNGKYRTIRMHSLIMNPPKGFVVDHINHDPLDNRRDNLRICTTKQNRHNSREASNSVSGYKGISRHSTENDRYVYWRVRFMVNGQNKSFGVFKNLQEAIRVYNEAVRKHHGEFAVIHSI